MSNTGSTQHIDVAKLCAVGITRSVRCHSDAMEYIDQTITMDDSDVRARLVKAWMLRGEESPPLRVQ